MAIAQRAVSVPRGEVTALPVPTDVIVANVGELGERLEAVELGS